MDRAKKVNNFIFTWISLPMNQFFRRHNFSLTQSEIPWLWGNSFIPGFSWPVTTIPTITCRKRSTISLRNTFLLIIKTMKDRRHLSIFLVRLSTNLTSLSWNCSEHTLVLKAILKALFGSFLLLKSTFFWRETEKQPLYSNIETRRDETKIFFWIRWLEG